MYKQTTNTDVSYSSSELESCMEGADIFTSALLYNLSTRSDLDRETYKIMSDPYRPDLIAKNFYGDLRYESFVILQSGGVSKLKIGSELSLVKLDSLKNLKNK